jgi:precorrin-6B C5,15-methyltransferase / cobalt-precorrin-6B C5,C15-methyltransferase
MSEAQAANADSCSPLADGSPLLDTLLDPIVQVVGVGLSGAESLTPSVLALVESATLLIGAGRHLAAFEYLLARKEGGDSGGDSGKEAWPLGDFTQVFAVLRSRLQADPTTRAVILASGDPLFFGVGRLLLEAFPASQLAFHPHTSAIQLAFSRLKLPWQDATLVSVHGRDEQPLMAAIKRGDGKIAVLTDGVFTPAAIASLITSLEFPISYRIWVCENLGGGDERLTGYWPHELHAQASTLLFAPLNVVVLLRQEAAAVASSAPTFQPEALPLIGMPDSAFKGFRDRPTLMTKREIRLLIIGALAPLDGQILWDIGAGTGSVSIELSRLCPNAQLYAIEKTAMGAALIQHNAEKLAIAPIQIIQGQAPAALANLPAPDRVFIGGSSGQLVSILSFLMAQPLTQTAEPNLESVLPPSQSPNRIVLALATLEHIAQITTWMAQPTVAAAWRYQLTQVNISRSLPVGSLTRFLPLNPITLVTITQIGPNCLR